MADVRLQEESEDAEISELENASSSNQDDYDTSSEVEITLDGALEKDEAEKELERLVFGDDTALRNGFKEFDLFDQENDDRDDKNALAGVPDADLFFTDDGDEQVNLANQPETRVDAGAAWEDSDDERISISLASVPRLRKLRRTEEDDIVDGVEYSRRLRQQFELLNPRPLWAAQAQGNKRRRLSQDSDSDGTDDLPSAPPLASLLTDASSLLRGVSKLRGKKRKLRPETISIQRMKDIGGTQPSAVTSLNFHPEYPILLSSGPSSTLYLHHIAASPPAPSPNPLLISLHIKQTPLATTSFCANSSRIFLSARRKYFHVWDLDSGRVDKVTQVAGHQHEQRTYETFKISPDGRYMALQGSTRKGGGIINILLTSTLQWSAQVRAEGRHGIADFSWWSTSRGLTILGKNGEINEWSADTQQIVARWQDEGAVGSTVLALGGQHEVSNASIGTDRWIAVGSSSGVVNIYDRRAMVAQQQNKIFSEKPKPYKTLDHLTTPISRLVFSPDGQVLAMASKWRKDGLRLVHMPSATVYRNWPTSSTPLGRITAVTFADGEIVDHNVHSLLAVANEQGKIRLWEIS